VTETVDGCFYYSFVSSALFKSPIDKLKRTRTHKWWI